MASGYFPLDPRYDEAGKRLLAAAEAIEAVVSEYWEYACDLSESDNAASDGASLALLGLAARLVRDELKKEPPKAEAAAGEGGAS